MRRTDSVIEHVMVCFRRMKNTTILKTFQDSERAWGLNIQKNEEIVQRFKNAIDAYERADRLSVGRLDALQLQKRS